MNFRRPLGTFKNRKIFDFGGQHGSKLASKAKPKSMISSKGGFFFKKPYFSGGKIHFFEIRGVEVGSKNWSKNNVKNDTETERLRNSIFIDFGWIWEPSWPSKTEPRRLKMDVEKASKFDQFLQASWNATFSAQEPPRRASAVFRRRRWSRPGPTGGGFRRGKTRTFEKKNPERDEKKDKKTLMYSSTRRTRWAADWSPPGGGVPPPKFLD